MIRVENVSKQFNKTRALKNVSLEVNKGDIISLIGPSGSGKSTLLRCIHGLEHVDTGKIYMDNEWMNPDDEKKFRAQRNRMGFVFQHFNLFPNMSVLQNCKLAQVEVLNKTDEEAEKIALEYLDKVGLLEKKDAYPNNLSGGQKQRVAIAGILAIEPDIIIFDESTSMLDPQGKASINAQIRKLHEEKNITILSITHDMEEVAQSENVIVLENGEIAMQGTPMDIFKQEDKLAKMQLDIPFALKISKELKKRGIFKENVCRLDEVVEKLCRLK